jgi:taurine dioxygenase
MDAAIRTNLEVVPLTKHIGAEIRGIDLRDTLCADTIRDIHKAWLDHLVLVFRGQRFSQEDLIRATGYFGEIGPLSRPPKYFPKGYEKLLPNVMLISNIRENGEIIGALPDGEMNFHHDMIHAELPHNGTLLYSVEIPSYGGDTLFASGYAAYDTLDPAVRHRLEGRRLSIITITAPQFGVTPAKPLRLSTRPCIRCFAPTTRPAARRSMSIAS